MEKPDSKTQRHAFCHLRKALRLARGVRLGVPLASSAPVWFPRHVGCLWLHLSVVRRTFTTMVLGSPLAKSAPVWFPRRVGYAWLYLAPVRSRAHAFYNYGLTKAFQWWIWAAVFSWHIHVDILSYCLIKLRVSSFFQPDDSFGFWSVYLLSLLKALKCLMSVIIWMSETLICSGFPHFCINFCNLKFC